MADYVSLIFPVGWQEPKNANNLSKLNTETVKTDSQIVFIDNRQNVFPGVSGAEWVNIILWNKGYNNNLDGNQLVLTNGENPISKQLVWEATQVEKPAEIKKLYELVNNVEPIRPLQLITSISKPYGLRKDALIKPNKYNLEPMQDNKEKETDIKIYGSHNIVKYIPKNYKLPRRTTALNKYKVFVGSAWGNMSENSGLGGAYANIILAKPNEICTETYQESGKFDDIETAKKHAKYLMTKFARAMLYVNKLSQMSTNSWGAVPIQDYSEEWWGQSIAEIDEHLFKKYNLPKEITDFIKNNIQTRTEANITNYYE